ncbi:MFS general substrate transporter [Hyaloscypha variabilis]
MHTEDNIEIAGAMATIEKIKSEDEFPSFKRVLLIMPAMYLSMFLVALDRTIIGTAIPKITDDFHSIDDVGWYASAYLLTSCAFQLIYGRIYTFYSAKWVLLTAIAIFETGSTVCGAAPNSKAFIVGRAIAGLGSAGIFSGCINIMVITIPLHKRPMYQGIFGAIFGLASVAGPLLGGAFTTKVSWRWCFYINLPVGGVVVAVILLILQTKPSQNTDTLRQQLVKLDPYGTIVFLPGVVARIIVLFILSAILLSAFVCLQFWQGDNATVPIRIIKQRSVASGVYFSITSPGSMMIMIYYLPLWFQAIKGVSAVKSGIDTLPLVLSLVIASIIAGGLTQKTGYYVPQLLACSVIMSIGAVLYGFGLGLGMQQAGMAAQTCLDKKDVMTGIALMFFMQGLGGSIFISVGQLVFMHSLVSHLSKVADLDPSLIVHTGATELRNLVPPQYLEKVLLAYNAALSDTLKVAVACASATILAGLTMEWKSLKGLKQGGASGEAERKKEEDEARGASEKNVEAPPRTAVESVVAESPKED